MKVNIGNPPGSGFRNITLFLFLLLMIIWASRDPQGFANFFGPALANMLKAIYATLKTTLAAVAEILSGQSASH